MKHEKKAVDEGDEKNKEIGHGKLRAVAFLCGAGLMGLEMAGVRLLEPHFGSTIFVWGSIIGIFLGALSIGYWIGGKLADRMPRIGILGGIILVAAILIFVVPPAASPLCGYLSNVEGMDPRVRALLGSLILYALPSICLGMVSPFAVRLAARRVSAVGSVAGSLYAFSTMGSLVGTFLVSFVLVEIFGSKAIVWGIGCLLLLVAALCFVEKLRGRGSVAAVMGLLLAFPGWLGLQRAEAADQEDALFYKAEKNGKAYHGGLPDEHILTTESAYHHVSIIRSYYNLATREQVKPGREIYYMLFNNQIESGGSLDAVDKTAPAVSACGYTRMLHLGVLFTGRTPRRVLIIGCGGGIGPQAFAHDYKRKIERIDVVDIDPLIFKLAHRYFRYPLRNSVIRSHVEDGRLFVSRAKEKWDYVVLDAYTSGGRIPRHLITREFFLEVRARLAEGGIVLANVISAPVKPDTKGERDRSRLFRSVYKTMNAVFGNQGHVYSFPRHRAGPHGENIILVATTSGGVVDSSVIRRNYMQLKREWFRQPGLNDIVGGVMVTAPDMKDVPLLTDDFCPTDSMVYW